MRCMPHWALPGTSPAALMLAPLSGEADTIRWPACDSPPSRSTLRPSGHDCLAAVPNGCGGVPRHAWESAPSAPYISSSKSWCARAMRIPREDSRVLLAGHERGSVSPPGFLPAALACREGHPRASGLIGAAAHRGDLGRPACRDRAANP
jgi:hypothetical protein